MFARVVGHEQLGRPGARESRARGTYAAPGLGLAGSRQRRRVEVEVEVDTVVVMRMVVAAARMLRKQG